jgi:N-acetylmuramoyl-L-alanine amidase
MSRLLNTLTLLVCIFAVLSKTPARGADFLGLRFGPDGEKTRIVFDLKGETEYAFTGDEMGKGRLLIDFADLSISAADQDYRPGSGHIARFGFAARPEGGVRAVLEFKTTAKVVDAFMLEPSAAIPKYRLVFDLQSADMPSFLASLPGRYPDLAPVIEEATAAQPAPSAPSAPSASAAPASPEIPPQNSAAAPLDQRKTVVIDPGHGGADPGAQGQSGTLEKHVTLAAALQLAEILEERDRYEVVLTRATDIRIRPDRREGLAREVGADLFISLHADAIAQSQVRGSSVYTLSERGSDRSAQLAKAEGNYHYYNFDTAKYDEDVRGILLDKAQDETNTASSLFAETLIDNLAGKTPLVNQSHRKGDLRVLLAPDVPAVLLEMAFISNAKDEANLNSKVWRRIAMTAVADAIDAYFAEHDGKKYAQRRAAESE